MPQPQRSLTPIQPSGPGGGTEQAVSQFMQTYQQAMGNMMRAFLQMQKAQTQQAQQTQQQTAATVENIANRITTDIEKREAKAERKAEQEAQREFQMDYGEYQQQLARDYQAESERVNQLKQQQIDSVKRYLEQFEERKAIIPTVNEHAWRVIEKLDQDDYWDHIPDGPQRRAKLVRNLRSAEAWNESHHSSAYTDAAIRQLYGTLEDIQAGKETYVDLRDIELDLAQLPLSKDAIVGADVELPEHDPATLQRIKNRQGWPVNGLFAAEENEQALVNPWTYSFIMKAIGQDELHNNLLTAQGREKYIKDRLKKLDQALPMLDSLEKLQTQTMDVYSPLAGSAVEDGLLDFVDDVRGGRFRGDPRRELAGHILGRLFQSSDPKYAALAMQVTDPSNPLKMEKAGDMVAALTVESGILTLDGHVGLILESEDQGEMGRLVWDLAENDPQVLATMGLSDRDIDALRSESDDDLARKTSATRRAVHRIISGVQHEFRNMTQVIDEQPVMKSIREDFGVLSRDLDTTLLQWQAAKSEEQKALYKSRMEELVGQSVPEDMTPEEWADFVDENSGAMDIVGFGRSMNQLESMVELFQAVPNKQASIFDLYSGGDGNMQSPNAQVYQSAVPILAESDPAVRARLDRYMKDYYEPLKARGQARPGEGRVWDEDRETGPQNLGKAAQEVGQGVQKGVQARGGGMGGAARFGQEAVSRGMTSLGTGASPSNVAAAAGEGSYEFSKPPFKEEEQGQRPPSMGQSALERQGR